MWLLPVPLRSRPSSQADSMSPYLEMGSQVCIRICPCSGILWHSLAFSGCQGNKPKTRWLYWCPEHLLPKPTDHQSQFILLHSNTLHEIIEMSAAWLHFEGLLVARHYNQGLCLVATYHRNSYQHPPQLQPSNHNICIAKGRGKSMMEIGYNHHIVNQINSNQTHLPYLLPHTPCWYQYIYIYAVHLY